MGVNNKKRSYVAHNTSLDFKGEPLNFIVSYNDILGGKKYSILFLKRKLCVTN